MCKILRVGAGTTIHHRRSFIRCRGDPILHPYIVELERLFDRTSNEARQLLRWMPQQVVCNCSLPCDILNCVDRSTDNRFVVVMSWSQLSKVTADLMPFLLALNAAKSMSDILQGPFERASFRDRLSCELHELRWWSRMNVSHGEPKGIGNSTLESTFWIVAMHGVTRNI